MNRDQIESLLNKLSWNPKGLIPAIAQDTENGEVLMMAWMSRESLQITLETNEAVYYSRSRDKLWKKGETSGNVQKINEIYFDCDADTLLLKVYQTGAACHTGNRSCFYQKVQEEGKKENE